MRFTKLKAAGIAAGVAVFALMSGPAQATGSSSNTDGAGVDYNPGCLISDPLAAPPAANAGGYACLLPALNTYDNSRGAEDLESVKRT